MRFHFVGLSYTQTSRLWVECAYTGRILRLIKAMAARGHECIHYGSEGAEVDCEHVTIMSRKEQIELCGTDRQKERVLSRPEIYWNPNSMLWRAYNGKTIAALMERAEKNDFVCFCHPFTQPVSTAVRNDFVFNCEIGIGYWGSWAPYRAFDSYAMMHMTWIHQGGPHAAPNEDHCVIPNLYDLDDFPAGTGGDYLGHVAFLGSEKGLQVCIDVARWTKKKLILGGPASGPQGSDDGLKNLTDNYCFDGVDMEYRGHVDQGQRAKLMGGALAVLCPSRYLEPFGGTNVEAQLYGTPAIASNWGGFVDTIADGYSGYRCRTMEQWIKAVHDAGKLNREYIRSRAIAKYSIETVGRQYEEWFEQIKGTR